MSTDDGSRRSFLVRVAHGLGGAAVGGAAWSLVVRGDARASPFALRPPGARAEREFAAKCIKCGQCVVDCPYGTLRLADVADPVPIGTPYFRPRDVPCYMCPDIPCVKACPTGALDPALTDIAAADMGVAALVDRENCLSLLGLRCEVCYRECPLKKTAIRVDRQPRTRSQHTVFIPVVMSDGCTGCGICERACPLPEPAIKVLPRRLAQGAPGEHYRVGGGEPGSITGAGAPARTGPGDTGLDYLNEEVP